MSVRNKANADARKMGRLLVGSNILLMGAAMQAADLWILNSKPSLDTSVTYSD